MRAWEAGREESAFVDEKGRCGCGLVSVERAEARRWKRPLRAVCSAGERVWAEGEVEG